MEHIVADLTNYNIYNFLSIYSLMILLVVTFIVGIKKKEVVPISMLTSILCVISFFFQIYYCMILIDNGIDVLNKVRFIFVFIIISVITFVVDLFLMIKNR